MAERASEILLPALIVGPWVVIGWYKIFQLASVIFF